MGKTEDIIGAVNGFLTVVAIAESNNGHRNLLCRCTCGREVIRAIQVFKKIDKNPKSCGCKRQKRIKQNIEEKRKPPNISSSLANQFLMIGW